MAKRKTHKKKHHRRVGAAGMKSGMLIKVAAIAAGYLAGDTLSKKLDNMLNKAPTDPNAPVTTAPENILVTAGEIGIGGLLLARSRGKGKLIKEIAGGFLVGAGVKRGLRKLGVVTGYQSVPVIGKRMAGYQSVPVINGMPSQLSGMPSQLSGGFRVNGYNAQGSGGAGIMNGISRGSGSGVTSSAGSEMMN